MNREILNANEYAEQLIHDIIPKNKLCHYTCYEALISILSSKELWFSDTNHTMDKTELTFFIDTIYKRALELLKNDPKFPLTKDKEANFNNVFQTVKKQILDSKSYLFCLTSNYDSSNHWMAFGRDGAGVCIVFNKFNLIKALNNFLFNKVYYGDNLISQHELFHKSVCLLYNGRLPLDYQDNILTFATDLILSSRFYKHYSFAGESEYRFTSIFPFNNNNGVESSMKKNGNIIPILKVNIAELCIQNEIEFEDIFDEIILGAKARDEYDKLVSRLNLLGYKKLINKIKISDCPLR